MLVFIRIDGKPTSEAPITFDNFLTENADGIDHDEARAIRSALERGETYRSGGGGGMTLREELTWVAAFGLALILSAPLIGKTAIDNWPAPLAVAADFPSVALLPIPIVQPRKD